MSPLPGLDSAHHPPRPGLLSRRRFLTVLGAGGLGAAGVGAMVRGSTPTPGDAAGGLVPVVRTSHALGTKVSLTALHEHPDIAGRAIEAAFAELDQVEEVMSLYRPHSQLCRLNREGVLDNPHPWLVEVLNGAQEKSRRSNGDFDVTVQPLWELYFAAHRAGKLPDSAAVRAARDKVDWRKLEVSAARVRLAGPGMSVTLNGIAQGYAADRVTAVLRSHGIRHALVDTGEIFAAGRKADGGKWTVGVQHPREPDAYVALAELEGRCMATSGDYATTFSPDRAYNHIFDPATGASPQHFSSVTIVAPTGLAADGLSTAVFVAGPDRGLELVRKTAGADALVVMKDGRTLATRGFPRIA